MIASYKRYWKNFFRFKETATRGEVWWPLLIHNILFIAFSVLVSAMKVGKGSGALFAVFYIVFAVTSLGSCFAAARRLKTIGEKRMHLLWLLFPFIGWIVIAILLAQNDEGVCKKKGHVFKDKPEECKEVCERCGTSREKHTFEGCKCKVCGKIQDRNHRFTQYIKEQCAEVCADCGKRRERHDWNHCTCTVCGKKRNQHNFASTGTKNCEKKCTVCGEIMYVHIYDANGECIYCGSKTERPFTLSYLNKQEIDSLKYACGIMTKISGLQPDVKTAVGKLQNVSDSMPLNLYELAAAGFAAIQVGQALSENPAVKNMMDTSINSIILKSHYLNLASAQKKIGNQITEINNRKKRETAAPEIKKLFVKKALSAFPKYDESYKGYVKGGICDVCNGSLEAGKAYAVDNKTFYDSPEYFEHLSNVQAMFGKPLTAAEYEQRRRMDTSPGSAVCEKCMRMFAILPTAEGEEKKWTEADNAGSRHDTVEKANAYWLAERPNKEEKPPFVLYSMSSVEAGEEALLELPFFHRAEDSKKIICERLMTFGAYHVKDALYEALVCGTDLSKEEFEAAKAAMEKHGGKIRNDSAPEKQLSPCTAKAGKAENVTYKEDVNKGGSLYSVYAAPKKADALAFLLGQKITAKNTYLVVDTPEGNIGRDINGIYEE